MIRDNKKKRNINKSFWPHNCLILSHKTKIYMYKSVAIWNFEWTLGTADSALTMISNLGKNYSIITQKLIFVIRYPMWPRGTFYNIQYLYFWFFRDSILEIREKATSILEIWWIATSTKTTHATTSTTAITISWFFKAILDSFETICAILSRSARSKGCQRPFWANYCDFEQFSKISTGCYKAFGTKAVLRNRAD